MNAQIEVPQPSPAASIEQQVGLTNVEINYSRPGVKGRTIFGDLVPYNKRWRTGANNNTTISFDTPVRVGGKELPEGTYAIYTVPGENEWEVIFYKDNNNWGLPQQWDENKVALRATAGVEKLPSNMETFTILVDNIKDDAATLNFLWENTDASLDFEVPSREMAMANIERVMSGPSAGDYFAAATYYHDQKKDLKKAYEWINKAVSMGEPAFWLLRRKALIEADMGMKKEAIATAKQSLAAAEKAGNQDYVKLNRDSLREWGAL